MTPRLTVCSLSTGATVQTVLDLDDDACPAQLQARYPRADSRSVNEQRTFHSENMGSRSRPPAQKREQTAGTSHRCTPQVQTYTGHRCTLYRYSRYGYRYTPPIQT